MRWWWLFVCILPLLATPAAARTLSGQAYQDNERPQGHHGRHGSDGSLSLSRKHGRHAQCGCDTQPTGRLAAAVFAPNAVQARLPLGPAQIGPAPTGFWYRCDSPSGYYPAVTRCSTPWREVAAQPVP